MIPLENFNDTQYDTAFQRSHTTYSYLFSPDFGHSIISNLHSNCGDLSRKTRSKYDNIKLKIHSLCGIGLK